MATKLERIHLADIWPSSVEPIQLLGSFDAAGELVFTHAPDLDREWARYPDEDAERFARRICNDLLAVRGRPPLPSRGVPQDRASAQPPIPDRGRHVPHHDGAVPARARTIGAA